MRSISRRNKRTIEDGETFEKGPLPTVYKKWLVIGSASHLKEMNLQVFRSPLITNHYSAISGNP
jgi:hypothetical protein